MIKQQETHFSNSVFRVKNGLEYKKGYLFLQCLQLPSNPPCLPPHHTEIKKKMKFMNNPKVPLI